MTSPLADRLRAARDRLDEPHQGRQRDLYAVVIADLESDADTLPAGPLSRVYAAHLFDVAHPLAVLADRDPADCRLRQAADQARWAALEIRALIADRTPAEAVAP